MKQMVNNTYSYLLNNDQEDKRIATQQKPDQGYTAGTKTFNLLQKRCWDFDDQLLFLPFKLNLFFNRI